MRINKLLLVLPIMACLVGCGSSKYEPRKYELKSGSELLSKGEIILDLTTESDYTLTTPVETIEDKYLENNTSIYLYKGNDWYLMLTKNYNGTRLQNYVNTQWGVYLFYLVEE